MTREKLQGLVKALRILNSLPPGTWDSLTESKAKDEVMFLVRAWVGLEEATA